MPKWFRVLYFTALVIGLCTIPCNLLLESRHVWQLAAGLGLIGAGALHGCVEIQRRNVPDEIRPSTSRLVRARNACFFLFAGVTGVRACLPVTQVNSIVYAVVGVLIAAAGFAIGRVYCRRPLLRPWSWILPTAAAALLGFGLSTIAQVVYVPWLIRRPYDDRPAIVAIAFLACALLGLLVDLRNLLFSWRAAESRPWNVGVMWLLTLGTLVPTGWFATGLYTTPSDQFLYDLAVAIGFFLAWLVALSFGCVGFLIQLVRNRWNTSLTIGLTGFHVAMFLLGALFLF
jgi:hypothetical protein